MISMSNSSRRDFLVNSVVGGAAAAWALESQSSRKILIQAPAGAATITGSEDGNIANTPSGAAFTFVPVHYQNVLGGTYLGNGHVVTGGSNFENINIYGLAGERQLLV